MAVQFDFTNMLSPACPGGLAADTLGTSAAAFTGARADVNARRKAGTLGFPNLPEDAALRVAIMVLMLAPELALWLPRVSQ